MATQDQDDIDLGDLIGNLLTQITNARVQADKAATQVAEEYAKDPLLKTFPIPRVRLPEVEIDLPVVLSKLPEASALTDELDMSQKDVEKAVETTLKKELTRAKVSPSTQRSVIAKVKSKSKLLMKSPQKRLELAKDLASETSSALRTLPKGKNDTRPNATQMKAITPRLHLSLAGALTSTKKAKLPAQPVKVIAQTGQVREVKDQQHLMQLRLKITEDGVEWSAGEEEGEETAVLVPE